MAKHRTPRKQLAGLTVVAGAVGISTALTLGHAVDATAAAGAPRDIVIGIGGNQNPTSDRIKRKFNGELVGELEADGYTFEGLPYPAEFPVDPSVTEAVPTLHTAIDDANSGRVVVIGYSQGALVAERVKRDLERATERPAADDLDFVFIASPFIPNGGIYPRFPGVNIPWFSNTGPAQPSQYDSTYYAMEYDIVADFPAYFNPLSLANAAVAFYGFHGDHGPDPVDLDTHPVSVRVVEDNGKGGTDTYVLIRTERLPLLTPIRNAAAAAGATPFVEPLLAAVEPTLRVLVDMGYTDRDHRTIGVDESADYQDAEQSKPFSMVTPADRIRESVEAIPDALREGAENFVKALPKPPAATTKPKPDEDDAPVERRTVKRNTLERAERETADDDEAATGSEDARPESGSTASDGDTTDKTADSTDDDTSSKGGEKAA